MMDTERRIGGCLQWVFINILILVLISGMLQKVVAQDQYVIDSLRNLLTTLGEDTTKVKTLNSLSLQLCLMGDSFEAKRYAGEGLALARTLGFKKGEGDISYTFGRIYAVEYNFPESLKWFESSLKIAEDIGLMKLIAKSNGALGTTHFYFGDYREALRYHNLFLELTRELGGSPKQMISAYNNIALDYWNLAEFPEACKNYSLGLRLGIECKDSLSIAWSYDALGQVYENEGNYPEAVRNFLAALNINTQVKNYGAMAANNNGIGEIYRKQHKYTEAIKYYEAALTASQYAGDTRQEAAAYNNLGSVYRLQGNFAEAEENILHAISLYRDIDFRYGEGYACNNIALLYYKIGMQSEPGSHRTLTEALDYAKRGIEAFEAIGQQEGVAECYITMGLVNTELRNFSEARRLLEDALLIAKDMKVKEKIRESYHALSVLDSITRNWEGAYHNHKMYVLYRDSLLNAENTTRIQGLQMQYAFDRKEDSLKYQQAVYERRLNEQTFLAHRHKQDLMLKESELVAVNGERRIKELELERNQAEFAIREAEMEGKKKELELLNKENEIQTLALTKQRALMLYLLGGVGILVVLAFFIYNNYVIRQRLKLQTLRNKIASDLHDDVGSTLSSISIFSEMAQKQSKEVIPALQTIGESSRKMLDAMADIVWTINPENDQFERILLRMRNFAYDLLGAKKIDFEFKANGDTSNLKLPMEVRKNLYLIFKEATNNMVKYSEANKATYSIKNENDQLIMQIRDNGKGFDVKTVSEGNGLRNMRKRAEEIGGVLSIDSLPGRGTTIHLRVAV